MKRWPLITSFVLFIMLCVSLAFWGMKLFQPPQRPVAAPPQTIQPGPPLTSVANLFGGRSNFTLTSNFQLQGVVVASDPTESVAILSNNGKTALAVRINSEAAPNVLLTEVHNDHVLLSEDGVTKRVELSKSTQLPK